MWGRFNSFSAVLHSTAMSEFTSTPNIQFREITRETVIAICRLKVSPEQEKQVAPNAISIAQAHFHPEAYFRGIYAGDEPVGFFMLEDHMQTPGPWPDDFISRRYLGLWRFMIDQRYQGNGHGAGAMRMIIEYARSRGTFRELLLSHVPGATSPHDFYARFGFAETGEMDGIERVMSLRL